MKKNNQVEYTIEDISNKPTPRLDELAKKINKLLAASCATFIPEACDALKEDWFPTMNNETLKKNPAVQKQMREKIISKFASDVHPCEGPWKERYISTNFADFLKYAGYQEGTEESRLAANEEKFRRKFVEKLEKVGAQQTLLELTENLPEPPEEPEPEVEPYTGGVDKKKQSTPQELYEDGVTDLQKVWFDLTGLKNLLTSETTDPLIDYIKPTREYRLRIFKGLDNARAIHYQKCLIRVNMLIQDTLKMCLEFNKENKSEIDK